MINGIIDSGQKIVTNGLVLHLDAAQLRSYSGSGTTWTDLSGNNYNGALTNGPTFNSGNGGSIVFDGVNDYSLVTNPSDLINQNFSVSIWIYPNSQNSAIKAIVDFNHGEGPTGWVIQSENATTNRHYYLAYYDGSIFQPSGGFGVGIGIQIINSNWQNLVYTKSGTSVIGYLNGNSVYSRTATNSNVTYLNNKNLAICTVLSVLARSFNGRVSNTLIYNRALSATEVLQNYNATKSRYGL